MKIKSFYEQFTQDPKGTTILISLLLLIWTIVLLGLAGLLFLYVERSGQASEPLPGVQIPAIVLEPATGPVGTLVTVRGEGWPAGSQVLIYLIAPDETEIPAYAIAGQVANPDGQFVTGFVFPAEPRWENQKQAKIIARTDDRRTAALANFNLVSQMEQPTEPAALLEPIATPTAPVEPTATPTEVVVPTAAPTFELPTVTPTPELTQPSVTSTTDLNIRSGPGLAYSIIGLLRTGQTAEVTGLSADGNWWQIKFPSVADGRGWVSAGYVTAEQTENVPIVQAPPLPATPIPTPAPTPTPPPAISDWRGEYYNNMSLGGSPIVVRNDVAIDFNWGTGAPASGLPVDNFSARWTRPWHFDEGVYRFHAIVDDGARVYVDNALVIDDWRDGGRREVIGDRWLSSGNHNLRIEYYEHTGDASITVWAEKISSQEPKADFDAEPRTGDVPLRVRFDNDSEGNYDSCKWTFGDDDTNHDCDDPSHTYRKAGQYTVKLRVSGPGGEDTKEKEDYIKVRPVAKFTADLTSGPAPFTVNFTNRSTDHHHNEWNFGDGKTSTSENPTHTYTTAGVYSVRLRVRESGVWSTHKTKTNYINVTGAPPVAAFAANPTTGQAPLEVQFSDQSAGTITAWSWDFGDSTTSPQQNPSHTYTAAGNYTVSLTVSGPGGSNTLVKAAYVSVIEMSTPTPVPPPQAKFIAAPLSGPAPLTVNFTNHSLNATDYSWDFGDGVTSPEESPSHIYEAVGSYTVRLTVSGPGGNDTVNRPNYITVNVPPTATVEPPTPTPTPTPTPEPPTPTVEPPTPTPEPATPIPTPSPEPPTPTVEPPTPTPEPPTPTPTPEPPTPTPEPPTPTVEPPTATPVPPTPTPEPPIPTPEPPTPTPEPPIPPVKPPLLTPTHVPTATTTEA